MKHEIRYICPLPEARTSGDGGDTKVSGLGIVYDSWTELWPGFKERITRGAARREGEVKSFVNHDPGQVLATTNSNPPLILETVDEGIRYIASIPPTSYGEDLKVNLERGNVQGSSFAFYIPEGGDRVWEGEDGVLYREISDLVYREIGPVTDPAYLDTSAVYRYRTSKDIYDEYQAAKCDRDEQEEQKARKKRALDLMEKEMKRYGY